MIILLMSNVASQFKAPILKFSPPPPIQKKPVRSVTLRTGFKNEHYFKETLLSIKIKSKLNLLVQFYLQYHLCSYLLLQRPYSLF